MLQASHALAHLWFSGPKRFGWGELLLQYTAGPLAGKPTIRTPALLELVLDPQHAVFVFTGLSFLSNMRPASAPAPGWPRHLGCRLSTPTSVRVRAGPGPAYRRPHPWTRRHVRSGLVGFPDGANRFVARDGRPHTLSQIARSSLPA